MKNVIIVTGGAAVGKTALLKGTLAYLLQKGTNPCICKMDCLASKDQEVYAQLKIPCVTGLSLDICPDHFLVSNLPELWQWAGENQADRLFIESAGLCHRCSPATVQTAAVCVVDSTTSSKAPSQLGPMLSQADCIVLTKIDLISQAEREILSYQIHMLNERATIFFVDGREGYGFEQFGDWILSLAPVQTYENDRLRHPMPSGICSYCVGEQRVGSAFQLGVVGKIDFSRGNV